MSFTLTIGLEIHVELKTKTKMFCGCLNNPDERRPNFNVCPVCMGHPGTLPVINEEALKKVIKTGLALNCHIPEYSKFDRKNYFYPDLPKGYQISQYDKPLCLDGFLEIDGKKIRIRRVHLEEDTGKLLHPEGADYSLVDFNRAGIPLMELVTEPDIVSAKEAREFAEELHLIMHYLDVSDADMEKGQMRVEVNISLGKEKGKLGTKVEIKNLNSFRAVERAVDYETQRQTDLLNRGERIIQETRGWNDAKEITVSQREKEEAHDYRYFPEPDLPPLHFTKKEIDRIQAEIPELPRSRRERLKREYNLSVQETEIFVYNKDLGEYFEKVISELPLNLPAENLSKLTKLSSNYLITDLQGLLKGASVTRAKREVKMNECSSTTSDKFLITAENFAEFITLIYDGQISSKIAKQVLLEMFKTGADPSNIIKEKGLVQITGEKEIEAVIKEVIAQNPKVIEDYKSGKENAFQFLIGQVMTKTKGKADPQLTNKILKELLTKLK